MKTALLRIAAVTVVTLLAYVALIWLLGLLIDGEPLWVAALVWAGAFWLGLVFSVWNFIEAILDTLVAIAGNNSSRTIFGGLWLVRSDMFQAITCLVMFLVGLSVVLAYGDANGRATLVLIGGLALVANQVWSRVDRDRIRNLPGLSRAALMQLRAERIAALGRVLGHDIPSRLQIPVGVIDVLLDDPQTPEQHRMALSRAVEALESLVNDVQAMHQQIRDLDPSYRPDDLSLLPNPRKGAA